MNIPEYFKYFSLISTLLFGIIALSLIKNESSFSLSKHTISKSVYFIKHPTKMLIFRFNFIIKGILDLGFIFYLISHLKISPYSPIATSMVISAVLFGSLSYFVMGKYTYIHRLIIFSYGILMGMAGIWLAQMTASRSFIILTTLIVILSNSLFIGFFLAKKINVFIQAICIFLLYGWLIFFVFRFI